MNQQRIELLHVLEIRAIVRQTATVGWVFDAILARARAAFVAGDVEFVAKLIAAFRASGGSDEVGGLWRIIEDAALQRGVLAAVGTAELALRSPWIAGASRGRREHPDAFARGLAARLAFTHRYHAPAILDAIYGRFGTNPALLDLLGCLVHELVIRGVDLGASRCAPSVVAALRAAGHELAELPLTLCALERDAGRRAATYHETGASSWGHDLDEPRDELHRSGAAVHELPADERIGAAFESHCRVSNGKCEVRCYAAPSLGALDAAECLHGATAIHYQEIAADRAFRALLAFAANGGDYNTAWSGAYGRRDAWRSLAGLVGSPVGASPAEIECDADGCRFFHIAAEAPWFYRIVTDFALAVVRRDGTIALLAGTDTD